MAYEDYCAACTYMGECADCGKYWCEKKGEDRYASDARCYSFCEAYSRSDYSRQNMYETSKNAGSGCYITTIMCELLGYEDNNYYLNKLRDFRDNVMKNNKEYIPLLMTYDMIGPMIADKLREDKYGKDIALTFFNKYISTSIIAIEEGKEKEAINTYVAMTDALAKRYSIDINLLSPMMVENINMKSLGHARVRKLNYGY